MTATENAIVVAELGDHLPPRPRGGAHRDPVAMLRVIDGAACATASAVSSAALTDAETQSEAAEVVGIYCNGCPVRRLCLEVGRNGWHYGTWGAVVLREGKVAPRFIRTRAGAGDGEAQQAVEEVGS